MFIIARPSRWLSDDCFVYLVTLFSRLYSNTQAPPLLLSLYWHCWHSIRSRVYVTVGCPSVSPMQLYSGDARVFGRLCCRPRQSDAATDILMVTTMALVWTVTNVTLYAKLRCNYGMQIPAESVLRCIRQFARSGQISEFHIFALPNTARCTVPPGAHAPPLSPA